MDQLIQTIAVAALPFLFAITVHEAAHAWTAARFGDKTAWMLGRVTLNPASHIDPLGTIVLPLLCLIFPGSFLFGWAKPVPVNIWNLRNPRRHMIWVAAAGPLSNLIMAMIWALLLKTTRSFDNEFLQLMAVYGVRINISLMALNLLPLLPLDGGRIVAGLLPKKLASQFARIEPYGFYILIALSLTSVLSLLMAPFLLTGYAIIGTIFGFNFF